MKSITDIIKELDGVFGVVFNRDIQLSETTTAVDVEGWDSIINIELIVAIEKHFNITFMSAELDQWQHVGDMAKSIQQKLPA
jgi:acyl carrier protein